MPDLQPEKVQGSNSELLRNAMITPPFDVIRSLGAIGYVKVSVGTFVDCACLQSTHQGSRPTRSSALGTRSTHERTLRYSTRHFDVLRLI